MHGGAQWSAVVVAHHRRHGRALDAVAQFDADEIWRHRRARAASTSIIARRRRDGPSAGRGARAEPDALRPLGARSRSASAARSSRRRSRTQLNEHAPERARSSTASARRRPAPTAPAAAVADGRSAVPDDRARPCSTTTCARSRPARRGRPARPPRPHPARLLQGRGEDRGDVPRRPRRRALGRSPATSPRIEADGTITVLGRGSQ